MSEPIVVARRLGRRFGRNWALAHLDLEVPPASVLVLAGANGSGKTTLLRLLAGLLDRSAGDLRVFGLDPGRERLACRRHLTMVAHHAYLYDELSALETLRIWNRLLGRQVSDEHLQALLDEVDLLAAAHREVHTFSAGMRKRLSLLRSRLENPRLLLLDEPFAALDPAGQELVLRWIDNFREQGGTVIMASHALSRIAALDATALVLERGQVAWSGASAELESHLYTAN